MLSKTNFPSYLVIEKKQMYLSILEQILSDIHMGFATKFPTIMINVNPGSGSFKYAYPDPQLWSYMSKK